MLRFVLLYHRCPPNYMRPSHWDLMLESGDLLRTWAIAQLAQAWQAAYDRTIRDNGECPPMAAGNEVEAIQLADHRRQYLEFEGELSGGRGSVIRVAEGTYRILDQSDERIQFELVSESLKGTCQMSRESDWANQWTLKVV